MSSSWHDLKKSSQPSLPSLVVNTDVYRDTLSGRHGRSVWGPSLALATVGLLPVLASVCVSAWVITEWKFFLCVRVCVCLTSSACCLLSIKSDPTTTSAAMHSDTLVLYLSSYMLSGLDCAWRQTRVKWWYDMRMSYCCCDIVLVFSACFGWTD